MPFWYKNITDQTKFLPHPSPSLYWGRCTKVLSLTNGFVFPIEPQIAPKVTSQLSVVDGTLSAKNPDLYYLFIRLVFNLMCQCKVFECLVFRFPLCTHAVIFFSMSACCTLLFTSLYYFSWACDSNTFSITKKETTRFKLRITWVPSWCKYHQTTALPHPCCKHVNLKSYTR